MNEKREEVKFYMGRYDDLIKLIEEKSKNTNVEIVEE